jgi:CubicO group peptidase (beta-lactamase class C family)
LINFDVAQPQPQPRGLEVEAIPRAVGLDADRLERIGTHFDRYVADERLAGYLALVARRGRITYLHVAGWRDKEASLPVEHETRWRIYSMTKPVTTVAAMMLWEEGAFQLKDRISKWIPSFADSRVWSGEGSTPAALREPIRIWHLLTHTAGLTYGFHRAHPVDALYREAGFEWDQPPGTDLAACCDIWAGLPLLFQPGSEWNYSVATDVLGRIVELASGMSLDDFFAQRIFTPLGMRDTAFWVPESDRLDVAALYRPDRLTRAAVRMDRAGKAHPALLRPGCLSGGGGLVSTAADYYRFLQCLAHGGQIDGVRLLGPRTVKLMTANHLPDNADLETFGRKLFAETSFDGMGFGLGFSVCVDPVAGKGAASVGEFGWGGAASTAFWVDPAEELTVLFMTQLVPSTTHPIRDEMHQLVHQALVD